MPGGGQERRCFRNRWARRQRIGEKKTAETRLGPVEINNSHKYASALEGSRLSPWLKELVVFAGQEKCYESAAVILEMFLGIKTSDSTIHRVTNEYGQKAAEWLENQREIDQEVDEDEVVYAQLDGGMLLMRQEGLDNSGFSPHTQDSCLAWT